MPSSLWPPTHPPLLRMAFFFLFLFPLPPPPPLCAPRPCDLFHRGPEHRWQSRRKCPVCRGSKACSATVSNDRLISPIFRDRMARHSSGGTQSQWYPAVSACLGTAPSLRLWPKAQSIPFTFCLDSWAERSWNPQFLLSNPFPFQSQPTLFRTTLLPLASTLNPRFNRPLHLPLGICSLTLLWFAPGLDKGFVIFRPGDSVMQPLANDALFK